MQMGSFLLSVPSMNKELTSLYKSNVHIVELNWSIKGVELVICPC